VKDVPSANYTALASFGACRGDNISQIPATSVAREIQSEVHALLVKVWNARAGGTTIEGAQFTRTLWT